MPRTLAIDYGIKRTGIATTDPMGIIASPLTTVPTHTLEQWLANYIATEQVQAIVLGMPKNLNNTDQEVTHHVRGLAKRLQLKHPNIPLHWVDERFTSKMAQQSLIDNGIKKKKRAEKGSLDAVSAAILLRDFMEQNP